MQPYNMNPNYYNQQPSIYPSYVYNQFSNLQQKYQYPEMQYQPQPLQTIQQNQTLQQLNGINGRIVQSVDNITANDVPMDGSVAFFPRQDMSEIYLKSWNADGTIKTIVYKPVTDTHENLLGDKGNLKIDLSDEAKETFIERFDDIIRRIEKLEQTMNKITLKAGASKIKREEAEE